MPAMRPFAKSIWLVTITPCLVGLQLEKLLVLCNFVAVCNVLFLNAQIMTTDPDAPL